MVLFESEFVRKLACGTVAAITRFDPISCCKVLRIAAAMSLVEFLLMVAIVMMGLPSHSKCSLSQTPIVVYTMLLVLSGITFYLCGLTVLWTPIARKLSAVVQRQRGSKWVPFFSAPVSTALLIPVFCGFTAFVALPLIAIIQDRLPLERCFFYL